MMMATEKADFFTAHDPDAFKAMKKAPGILRLSDSSFGRHPPSAVVGGRSRRV